MIGVAAVIASVATLIGTILNSRGLHQARGQREATHQIVKQIDSAVNGKTVGEMPMVQQVQELHDEIPDKEPQETVFSMLEELRAEVHALKGRFDVLDR